MYLQENVIDKHESEDGYGHWKKKYIWQDVLRNRTCKKWHTYTGSVKNINVIKILMYRADKDMFYPNEGRRE